jgi:hypothetical protein
VSGNFSGKSKFERGKALENKSKLTGSGMF